MRSILKKSKTKYNIRKQKPLSKVFIFQWIHVWISLARKAQQPHFCGSRTACRLESTDTTTFSLIMKPSGQYLSHQSSVSTCKDSHGICTNVWKTISGFGGDVSKTTDSRCLAVGERTEIGHVLAYGRASKRSNRWKFDGWGKACPGSSEWPALKRQFIGLSRNGCVS